MVLDSKAAGPLISGRASRREGGSMAARQRKPKPVDVMLTRGVMLPNAEGEVVPHGPEKRGGAAVKVTISRPLARQVVQGNRGYYADGEPPPERATDEPPETTTRAPARARGAATKEE